MTETTIHVRCCLIQTPRILQEPGVSLHIASGPKPLFLTLAPASHPTALLLSQLRAANVFHSMVILKHCLEQSWHYLGAEFLEKGEPTGIQVPPLLSPAHRWALLPLNTVVKEASLLFRQASKNNIYWNVYSGIKPFKEMTIVGISTRMTLPLVFLQ